MRRPLQHFFLMNSAVYQKKSQICWPSMKQFCTAIFFKLLILKSKSKTIFTTWAYAQVGEMVFDFDFKINM